MTLQLHCQRTPSVRVPHPCSPSCSSTIETIPQRGPAVGRLKILGLLVSPGGSRRPRLRSHWLLKKAAHSGSSISFTGPSDAGRRKLSPRLSQESRNHPPAPTPAGALNGDLIAPLHRNDFHFAPLLARHSVVGSAPAIVKPEPTAPSGASKNDESSTHRNAFHSTRLAGRSGQKSNLARITLPCFDSAPPRCVQHIEPRRHLPSLSSQDSSARQCKSGLEILSLPDSKSNFPPRNLPTP